MEFADPRPFKWTKDLMYLALDANCFLERRVQLIDGDLVETSRQSAPHAVGISLTVDALRRAFGPEYWVRNQGTLDLSQRSVVDPDAAVVPGNVRSHRGQTDNPTTSLLVVEVADTTLDFDRNAKASLYAASGIADYWILNLVDRQLEVYRDPVADPTKSFGHRYATRTDLGPADSVCPLALPGASIAVADLLP
jgi:Uma2 family endonuclease